MEVVQPIVECDSMRLLQMDSETVTATVRRRCDRGLVPQPPYIT